MGNWPVHERGWTSIKPFWRSIHLGLYYRDIHHPNHDGHHHHWHSSGLDKLAERLLHDTWCHLWYHYHHNCSLQPGKNFQIVNCKSYSSFITPYFPHSSPLFLYSSRIFFLIHCPLFSLIIIPHFLYSSRLFLYSLLFIFCIHHPYFFFHYSLFSSFITLHILHSSPLFLYSLHHIIFIHCALFPLFITLHLPLTYSYV